MAERKKADRLAKQIRTQLESAEGEEKERLQAELHIAEIDGTYARFFPHRERYISLYPVSGSSVSEKEEEKVDVASKAALALRTERPPIWHDIERAAKKGMPALVSIRERNVTSETASGADLVEPLSQDRKHQTKVGKAQKDRVASSSGVAKDEGKLLKEKTQGKSRDKQAAADSDSDSDGGFFE